jgi:hypothetical protein
MNTDTRLIKQLIDLAHREHLNCEEDTWYGCPLSRDGCSNDAIPANKCNCGADEHNAEVDRIAAILLLNDKDLARRAMDSE